MGLILDTSALVAWERAENAGQTLALDGGEELLMPAVVWAEALAGVRLADSAARACPPDGSPRSLAARDGH